MYYKILHKSLVDLVIIILYQTKYQNTYWINACKFLTPSWSQNSWKDGILCPSNFLNIMYVISLNFYLCLFIELKHKPTFYQLKSHWFFIVVTLPFSEGNSHFSCSSVLCIGLITNRYVSNLKSKQNQLNTALKSGNKYKISLSSLWNHTLRNMILNPLQSKFMVLGLSHSNCDEIKVHTICCVCTLISSQLLQKTPH